MEHKQLEALLKDNVNDINKMLNELYLVDLARLRTLESAGENRVSLLQKIDDEFKDREEKAVALAVQVESLSKGAGKAERGEEATPEWKKPEYSGPLSADQAAWRNEHISIKEREAAGAKTKVQTK